jgi:MFS family permease
MRLLPFRRKPRGSPELSSGRSEAAAIPSKAASGFIDSVRGIPGTAWILVTGIFINSAGDFLLLFLALYVKKLGYSAALSGSVIGLFQLGRVGAGVLGGILADRVGRRFTIVLSMLLSAAAALSFTQAHSLTSVLVLAPIAGLVGGGYRPAANAMLGDVLPEEHRLVGYGAMGVGFNLGAAVAGILGGFLATQSFDLVFITDAITAVGFAAIALFFLPPGKVSQESHDTTGGSGSAFPIIKRDLQFLLLLLSVFLISMVYIQWVAGVPLQVVAYGHTPAVYGALWTIASVWILLFQLPLLAFGKRFPTPYVIAVGYLLFGLGCELINVGPAVETLVLAISVMSFGELLFWSSIPAYVSELAPARVRGRYQGAALTTDNLGRAIGPVAGGAIFSFSPFALWALCGPVCVLAAGLLLVRRGDRKAAG